MSRRARLFPSGLVFLAALAWLLPAAPAAADWLVMQDGSRVETRGGWEVRGKLVVFTREANGTLASLRVSEVDLEASEAATEAAKNPPPPEPKAEEKPRKPVLVLTDADVGHVRRDRAPPGGEAAAAGGEGEGEQAAVEVVRWSPVEQEGTPDVQLVGTLRNNSAEVVTGLVVIVRLYDSDQQLVAETPALFSPNSLAPGATVAFRALFPGIYGFVTASFEIRSTGAWRVTRPPEAALTEGEP